MVSLILASQILVQAPAQSPAAMVSKMLARYSSAKALYGTITFRQTFEQNKSEIQTYVQFQRPDKLYIRQTKLGDPKVNITAADGQLVTYEVPPNSLSKPGQRMYEPQWRNGIQSIIQEVYTAASASLIDRSPALDILIGKKEYLKFRAEQLATVGWLNDTAPAAGQSGVIVGNWREYPRADVSGKYSLSITSDGDLARYQVQESIVLPGERNPKLVVSDWSISIKVGEPGDLNLYKVKR